MLVGGGEYHVASRVDRFNRLAQPSERGSPSRASKPNAVCARSFLSPCVRPLSIRIESPIRTDYGSRNPSLRLHGSIPQNYVADFSVNYRRSVQFAPENTRVQRLGSPPLANCALTVRIG